MVFKWVFLIDNKAPLVSFDSSLVPTSKRIPISILVGNEADSVKTVIPLLSFVVSIYL